MSIAAHNPAGVFPPYRSYAHAVEVPESAAVGYSDLVSLRFFLASAADDPANVEILTSHLDGHLAARTVVVQQLLDPRWLIEVEAAAAKVA